MANTIYVSRSNYFHVKDETAFRSWCKSLGVHIEQNSNDEQLLAIFTNGENGWPVWAEDGDGEDIELDFYAELATHLVDTDIAVLQQIYFQKLRFIGGISVAVASDGTQWTVELEDIYDKVASVAPDKLITNASY